MSVETVIYSVLAADSTVAGLVSTRIYPDFVPQDAAMPAITYSQISGNRDYTMDGASGMVRSRFQITCWDDDYGGTRTLADAVRAVLSAYSSSANNIDVMFLDDEGDMPVWGQQADQLRRHGKRLDFVIWFRE